MCSDTMRESSEARARAAAYGLIAACFRDPDAAWLKELKTPNHWAIWPDHLPQAVVPTGATLAALRRWLQKAGAPDLSDIIASHATVFGHSVRGTCPPYELEYGTDEILQRASELADIAGFYAAFGMEMSRAELERTDHVSAQCEFMSALCQKQAHVAQSGDAGGLEVCRHAQRQFLRSHLGRWLPAFVQRLADLDRGFYSLVANFAGVFIEDECTRLQAPHGSPYLQLRPVDAERETEQTCGPEVCGAEPAQLTPLTIGQS
jgi:TorA maturation chaperone TorD